MTHHSPGLFTHRLKRLCETHNLRVQIWAVFKRFSVNASDVFPWYLVKTEKLLCLI